MTPLSKDMLDEKPISNAVLELANQIWLAGLGAFTKARQQGGKLFEALVQEGEMLEAMTRKTTDSLFTEIKGTVETVRGNATEQVDRLELAFQDRVARVLAQLGVPTNQDIQEIASCIEALSASLRQLSGKK